MKISIAKTILENILIHSQAFLEKKDTSQITSHIFLQTHAGKLLVQATDHEIGLKVQTDQLETLSPGSITANGKKLLDIVRILKDDFITLESIGEMLHISQGQSSFKLPTFNANEFPEFPSEDSKPKINLDSAKLISSLKKITPAIDNNNPKFELNGALIDISKDKISIVSTDTRRLALVEIENNSSEELSIIIPKKAIIEIQKLFFNAIEIYYDNTHLIIKSDQYTFFTKLINGKFPDYTRIIPKETNYNLSLPKAMMIDAIKQITTISNDLKITFENGLITFESLSEDNIEAKTQMAYETPFTEAFVLAINSKYILDFLAQIHTNEFNVGLNESNLPFVVSSEDFKTIVMPIVI
ncbi:DNA polymerase III subunit beta [Sulfurimonas sp. MAG313]|nr:DNA polymerase III subunit beta [Sulfurimonas sp. MAG313]MDF1880854.1 DNA polymerase III subunit beta [Sulfurimonas sp. MAG313]